MGKRWRLTTALSVLGVLLSVGSVNAFGGSVYWNDALIAKQSGSWGTFGVYPQDCWLIGSGQTTTFTADYPWTAEIYGQARNSVVVDGNAEGYADGGGSVSYTSGPFPAGDVVITTETANGAANPNDNGGGGASFCGRVVHVEAAPTPTPEPSATPTPAPDPICAPYCIVALMSEDRDRLDWIRVLLFIATSLVLVFLVVIAVSVAYRR